MSFDSASFVQRMTARRIRCTFRKMYKIIRNVLSASLLMAMPVAAHAEEACPANAEQQLYDLLRALKSGINITVTDLLAKMDWAAEACPDRREVQAIVVVTMTDAMKSSQDGNVISALVDRALSAYELNSLGDPATQGVVVSRPDGHTETLNLYREVETRYQDVIAPYMVRLAQAGLEKPYLDGSALSACPVTANSIERLENESVVWSRIFPQTQLKTGSQLFDWATQRMSALSDACLALASSVDGTLNFWFLTRAQHLYSRMQYPYNQTDQATEDKFLAAAKKSMLHFNRVLYRKRDPAAPFVGMSDMRLEEMEALDSLIRMFEPDWKNITTQ